MTALTERSCEPCSGDVPPLESDRIDELRAEIPDWEVVEMHHLVRAFEFPDFATALEFTNRVGELAEEEGHHPDLHLSWGQVEVEIWTHAIDGLTESDFILAAKIDELES